MSRLSYELSEAWITAERRRKITSVVDCGACVDILKQDYGYFCCKISLDYRKISDFESLEIEDLIDGFLLFCHFNL